MPELDETSRLLLEQAPQALGVHPSLLRYVGIGKSYAWLRVGELIVARSVDDRAAVFWALYGYEPVHMNGPDGLARLGPFIVDQLRSPVWTLSADKLAAAIRQLTVEPRGFVGGKALLDEASQHWRFWLATDDEANRDKFKSHCAEPVLKIVEKDKKTPAATKPTVGGAGAPSDDGKAWTLAFFYFTSAGAVEMWEAAGDSSNITAAKSSPVQPPGTFRFPYA